MLGSETDVAVLVLSLMVIAERVASGAFWLNAVH
jgi:hypothetical protein